MASRRACELQSLDATTGLKPSMSGKRRHAEKSEDTKSSRKPSKAPQTPSGVQNGNKRPKSYLDERRRMMMPCKWTPPKLILKRRGNASTPKNNNASRTKDDVLNVINKDI